MAQKKVVGEYYFRKMEMVAGFKFSADGKFDFFYSYGAVDRSAAGTFLVSGDTLKLSSSKEAGKDFTVTKAVKSGNGYTLRFVAANPYLLSHIRCTFFIGDQRVDEYTDDKGVVTVKMPHCDKIYVQHGLFPDIVTLIKDEKNENNDFTLSLNPSLEQVSFKGIDFRIEDDSTLSCYPNYFMEMEHISFVKQ